MTVKLIREYVFQQDKPGVHWEISVEAEDYDDVDLDDLTLDDLDNLSDSDDQEGVVAMGDAPSLDAAIKDAEAFVARTLVDPSLLNIFLDPENLPDYDEQHAHISGTPEDGYTWSVDDENEDELAAETRPASTPQEAWEDAENYL